MHRATTRSQSLLAAGAALSALLTGCGSDSEPTGSAEAMESMDSMMNDPDATPADELSDADVARAEFTVLDTAPPGSDDVTGTAWLAQSDAGTTVTVRLQGLEPGTEYVSHLHEQSCAQDNGGDHFAFDPEGPEEPPNEVHLMFQASGDGTAEATVTNDRKVGEGARAAVVHPVEAMDNRLACADFSS